MNTPTIPLQIDSMKSIGDFQRARCVYYRVEFVDGPSREIFIMINGVVQLAAWGQWAVLSGPSYPSSTDESFFDTSSLINETFQTLEETEGLFLDMGHIWLPNELLNIQSKETSIRSGDVYRIPFPLFRHCYRFVMDTIKEEEWLELCKSFSDRVQYSPRETLAFREWRKEQIKISREHYHHPDYASRRLPKKKRRGAE